MFYPHQCDGLLHFGALIYVLTPFPSEVINFPTIEMGVAQKTTFSTPESLKKIFGVSGDLMEYNERGKPLKRLSSLTNPKSAGQNCARPSKILILIIFLYGSPKYTVGTKITARKYSPKSMITKRDFILCGSCFCKKYSYHMHTVATTCIR